MSDYKEKFNSDVEEMLAKQDGYIPNTQLNSLLEIQDKAISELRAKLVKADKVVQAAEKLRWECIKEFPTCPDAEYVDAVNDALKDYREQKGPNE